MTLESLVQKYIDEPCEYFKYRNSVGDSIDMLFIFESHKDYLDTYLKFYKQLPNLTEVIVFSCDGEFKLTKDGIEYFIRHNHQEVFVDLDKNVRGVSLEITKLVRNNLFKRLNEINAARSFDELMQIVTESKVKGFGELSIYDTTIRIARFKNLEPDKVYLHAGARKGFEILEQKGYISEGNSQKKYLTREQLPKEFSDLKIYEVENHSCLYKDQYKLLENKPTNDLWT